MFLKFAKLEPSISVPVENLDTVAMHFLLFEHLYDYAGSAHLIMIPMTHRGKHHFTLLTFNPVVNMINMLMRGVEFQAEEMLRTRQRKKLNKGVSTNFALRMDLDDLTEKEILTIKWVQENYKSNFKLVDQKKIVPKQAFGSLDCGVYVMHYMNFLANEKYVCCEFDENDAIRFRADLVNRFAKSSKCWRADK